ncbi:unnamed protein product [Urochloa humidicola]
MEIKVQSSTTVKPAIVAGGVLPTVANAVPLTVFDKATYNKHIGVINLFHPPTPPNAILKAGLSRALAEFREWAGRLDVDGAGNRVIRLNDAGARFVEATADVALGSIMPLDPTLALRSLHPDADGAEELLLVQVTRFACGSLAVSHSMHHVVADGTAYCNFILAWGQTTRGVPIDPAPVHDRASMFVPRCSPRVEFNHRGAEFKAPMAGEEKSLVGINDHDEVTIVQRVRFSHEFIAKLKSLVPGAHSTFTCVTTHLWRCITEARGLRGGEVTTLRVAVNGRERMHHPRVPEGYTGNAVLSARPAITAGDLLASPLLAITELIAREVARMDDVYFRSFIDFASSGAVEEERLVPVDDAEEMVYSPDVEVDSLLGIPFLDLDFGSGPSFFFMPSYLPVEGCVFLARSFRGDRSVYAYVPLFRCDIAAFNSCCYSLPVAVAHARL